MDVWITASQLWILFSIYPLKFTSADQKNITAQPKEDVILTCRAPNKNPMIVEWSRADLGNEYVFVHWNSKDVPDEQHPSFKDRVDLQDRQMKDGDVSLILKDVTINDAGTYECHVFMEETRSWKSITIITLRVVDPPDQKTITADCGCHFNTLSSKK
ncbi:butyrophilin-like protein 10 isoform X2 [Simochromis diagramma]|uniref:butyrophilin-like protein 10 isoform X2 n=1 Tax=Simochromis diagramma TaxID=43689 RepID=UPI001A7EA4EE|nr:butyrophilin-like protein 10 isoform X2 [Simochromis diagramma]